MVFKDPEDAGAELFSGVCVEGSGGLIGPVVSEGPGEAGDGGGIC